MKNNILYVSITMLAMLLSGFSLNAAAYDEKYPGTVCHGYRSADANNLRHGYIGEIMNNGTGTSTLNCPLIRKTGPGYSTPYLNLEMIVNDTSTLGVIECNQMNRSALGSLGSWKVRSSTGIGDEVLGFGAETYVYAGYSYFRCYFPATNSGEYVSIKDYVITY